MPNKIKATLEDTNLIEDHDGPKTVKKSTRNAMPKNYDGKTELSDPKQEAYIHSIIANLGNRVKAFNDVYYPGVENPQYSRNMPYRFFERKAFSARYNYLMKQASYSAGVDKRTLLLKAATLVDEAVKKKSVRDFATMVDTIMKLEAPVPPREKAKQAIEAQAVDTAKIKELMKDLEG